MKSTPSPAMRRALAAHPVDVGILVEELHRRVHDIDSLVDLMFRACREAVRIIQDAHYVGVSAQFDAQAYTTAHSDHRVLIVDEAQYGEGDGPCLLAARSDRQISMTLDEVRGRWPLLADIAESAGIHSFHAAPMHLHQLVIGSLNLYSGRVLGLRVPDPDVLAILMEYLERGFVDFAESRPGELQVLLLRDAMHKRQRIQQAIGLLMGQHMLDSDQAMTMLRSEAEHRIVDVDLVATELLRRHDLRSGEASGFD